MDTAKEIVKSFGAICFLLLLCVGVLRYLPEQPASIVAKMAQSTVSAATKPLPNLSWLDNTRFRSHIESRLPRYKSHFERAAENHGIPWTLLAAQAYQESRWNRHAISPTGVRGIMMLTRTTAAELGIENRLDPTNSIHGGAQYFVRLLNQIPDTIQDPDRIWFALAAYNVGMGHIKDARQLAIRLDKNPNRWDHVKTVLPLLSKKQYYRTLKHGYARGHEPVQYVSRIQNYWKYLDAHFGEV